MKKFVDVHRAARVELYMASVGSEVRGVGYSTRAVDNKINVYSTALVTYVHTKNIGRSNACDFGHLRFEQDVDADIAGMSEQPIDKRLVKAR